MDIEVSVTPMPLVVGGGVVLPQRSNLPLAKTALKQQVRRAANQSWTMAIADHVLARKTWSEANPPTHVASRLLYLKNQVFANDAKVSLRMDIFPQPRPPGPGWVEFETCCNDECIVFIEIVIGPHFLWDAARLQALHAFFTEAAFYSLRLCILQDNTPPELWTAFAALTQSLREVQVSGLTVNVVKVLKALLHSTNIRPLRSLGFTGITVGDQEALLIAALLLCRKRRVVLGLGFDMCVVGASAMNCILKALETNDAVREFLVHDVIPNECADNLRCMLTVNRTVKTLFSSASPVRVNIPILTAVRDSLKSNNVTLECAEISCDERIEEARLLLEEIQHATRLNRAGRGYLHDKENSARDKAEKFMDILEANRSDPIFTFSVIRDYVSLVVPLITRKKQNTASPRKAGTWAGPVAKKPRCRSDGPEEAMSAGAAPRTD